MATDVILKPDETIVRQFSISTRFVVLLILVGIALGIDLPILFGRLLGAIGLHFQGESTVLWFLGGGVGLALILYALYFRAARAYILTNQRVIARTGFLAQQTVIAEFDDITDSKLDQDFFERLLNIGRVQINTAGSDIEEILLERIDQPAAIISLIRELCASWAKNK